jgi:hypothetical protein
MRLFRSTLVLVLSVLMATPALAQQRHVASPAALDRAIAEHLRQADADRQAIRDVLQRPEVREIATHAGLDVARAERAVATLDGAELQQIAAQARAVDNSLAGGQNITLSATTIIIILLVVILIIVAVN